MSWELLTRQVETLELQAQSLAAQLASLKATANALMIEPLPAVTCDHADVDNLGTFQAPEYRCKRCGAVVK